MSTQKSKQKVSQKPKCMRMQLPFSDHYLYHTKLRTLRKTIRDFGFDSEEYLLIMQRRRLLKCRDYVYRLRQKEKQRIEALKLKKAALKLEKEALEYESKLFMSLLERAGGSLHNDSTPSLCTAE